MIACSYIRLPRKRPQYGMPYSVLRTLFCSKIEKEPPQRLSEAAGSCGGSECLKHCSVVICQNVKHHYGSVGVVVGVGEVFVSCATNTIGLVFVRSLTIFCRITEYGSETVRSSSSPEVFCHDPNA